MEQILFTPQGMEKEAEHFHFSELEANIAQQIGANLKAYRQKFSFTQQHQANLMGVSLSQYRKYESGIDTPRYHTACRWGMSTGASIYHLLLNTPYEKLLPEYLVAWKLIPFGNVIARLTDRAYLGLVTLVRTLQFTREIVIPGHLDSDVGSIDIDKAFAELEHNSYAMISLNLRLFRENRAYSQEQMSELLGININTYRNYENAKLAPKFSMLFAIRFFMVFGCHMSALMPDSLFCKYLKQFLQRISYLAPTLYKVSPEQYEQLRELFEQIEVMAEGNGAYLF